MSIQKWLKLGAATMMISMFWIFLASLGSGGTLNFVETPLRDLMRQKSDAERAPDNRIKIIKIDEDSLEQLGQFPWDRSLYAELITMLAEAGAEAIFLDIVLAEPGQNPEADAYMAEVMGRYGNVILPAVFNMKVRQTEAGKLEADSVIYPAATIQAPRDQVGHINVMQDKDGTVRMLTIGLPDPDGEMMPAVSVKLANHLLAPNEQIRYDSSHNQWLRGSQPIPLNSKNQVATDFFSEPREQMTATTGYDTQSFFDVLSGEVPADYFSGDIVLIGPWASGLQDEYLTPLSKTLRMYGVEIHANMVQSLAMGAFYFEAPAGANYAIIVLLTLLALMLFERFRGRLSFAVYAALTAAYVACWLSLYFFSSLFISLTYPFLALTTALVWSIVAHYTAERRERGRVTNIFGRFVPRSVVDEMLASGKEIKVGGQRRDISVIFVDIRGFTPMSERLQPEEVIQVLNEYLDICTKAVFHWQGTLDKFIGDGVMAFFGAPLQLDNHPELAVRAALEMKRQSDILEQKCIEQFGIGVKFGVGINCGPAVVGNIGSEMLRLDYTAIGDTVNLAARLESNAKPGQILISEELHRRTGHLFVTEDMGEIKVKGKEKPVRVFAVMADL
ncbi:CHASE2 domain-containing protein [Paenibacillus sp. SYP-B4298]|uniref:CHASE2 domain-containing protein n=1 Tax=Paenibacillus sp. SYP-B4298 TaxID=2996034 RepID=UPI0022DE5A73|nr:adenylate/guanylate cyclase domain-containing protein [Paenibacillus sp. SYP-B4298]